MIPVKILNSVTKPGYNYCTAASARWTTYHQQKFVAETIIFMNQVLYKYK